MLKFPIVADVPTKFKITAEFEVILFEAITTPPIFASAKVAPTPVKLSVKLMVVAPIPPLT